MKNSLEIIDVSEKKDNFMKKIYISLIVLVVLSLVLYFFGYEVVKPFISV